MVNVKKNRENEEIYEGNFHLFCWPVCLCLGRNLSRMMMIMIIHRDHHLDYRCGGGDHTNVHRK